MKEKKMALIGAGIVLAGLIGLGGFYTSSHQNRFYDHTSINGIDVSNMTVKEAEEAVNTGVKTQTFTIVDENKVAATLSGEDLKLSVDLNNDIDEFKKDTDKMFILNRIFGKKSYTTSGLKADVKHLESVLKTQNVVKEGEKDPTTNADVIYNKDTNKYVIKKEHQGRNFNTADLANSIASLIKDGNYIMDLSTNEYYIQPTLLSDNKSLVKERDTYNKYVGGSVKYRSEGKTVVALTPDTYHKWLSYEDGKVSLSTKKIKKWIKKNLKKHYDTINQPLKFKTHKKKKTVKLTVRTLGKQLNLDDEVDEIKKNITKNQAVSRSAKCETFGGLKGSEGEIGKTYVEVDISKQTVYVYKKGKLKYKELCVTGNPNTGHATDEGVFYIQYKSAPATLHGFENGKHIYDTRVNYWMPFHSGEGLHDALWQPFFGGSRYLYAGSHGCVNLSYKNAQRFYKLLKVNTPVIVHK